MFYFFFLGFYLNENSAGAGGYDGDINLIIKNIEIFKNNDLIEAIFHEDMFGNRTPLIYIINKLFNPFFFEYEKYRFFVFFLSLTGPYFIFLCLKKKYPDVNTELLLLTSSVILLSPFYRTSGYWGMNENYGIISTIISLMTLSFFLKKIELKNQINKYFYLTIFFSSLSIYFDQKCLIITMICFFSIVFSNIQRKYKFYALVIYIFLSIPYLILIFKWGGLVPIKTQVANPNAITNISRVGDLYFYHLGYLSTIVGFYLFPLILLKERNISKIITNFISSKWFYVIVVTPLLYIFFIYTYYDFKFYTVDNYWVGLGAVHKIANIMFINISFREIFTYTTFFFSWIIIFLYLEKEITDYLILIFFFILSLFIWPLMQEYMDPIIIILSLMAFKTKMKINFYKVIFLFLYFSIFLISSNLYYSNI